MARRDWTVPFETWPNGVYGLLDGSVRAHPLWLPLSALEPGTVLQSGVPSTVSSVLLEAVRGKMEVAYDPVPFNGSDWVSIFQTGICLTLQDYDGTPVLPPFFDFNDCEAVNAMDWLWLDSWMLYNRSDWWTDAEVYKNPNKDFDIHVKSKRRCPEGTVACLVTQLQLVEGEPDPAPQVWYNLRVRTLVDMGM